MAHSLRFPSKHGVISSMFSSLISISLRIVIDSSNGQPAISIKFEK